MNIRTILVSKNKSFWLMGIFTLFLITGCYQPPKQYQRMAVHSEGDGFYVVKPAHKEKAKKVERIEIEFEGEQYYIVQGSHGQRQKIERNYMYKGAWPTSHINKRINLCRKHEGVLYVKMHNHSSIDTNGFTDKVMATLSENTFFSEIATRTPTIYINVEPKIFKMTTDGRRWYDSDDPLTIGDIKKRYPDQPLLILEVRLQEFSENEPLAMSLNLIDPSDGSSIVALHNSQAAWYWAADLRLEGSLRDFNNWFEYVDEYCECRCKVE